MNSVCLVGRLTRKPELTYTPGENPTAIAKTGIAVDRIGKGKGANFFNLTCFGQQAEFMVNYLDKGDQVGVEGELSHHTWEQNGQHHEIVEVIGKAVSSLETLASKQARLEAQQGETPTQSQPTAQAAPVAQHRPAGRRPTPTPRYAPERNTLPAAGRHPDDLGDDSFA